MAVYRGKDLRKGRRSEVGRAYLLTSVTYGRRPMFRGWRTGAPVAQALQNAAEEGWAESLAWVIMPDHFHWLAVLQSGTVSQLMQRVKSRSALAVNRYLGRTGRIWQSGYYDHALRKEEDLRQVARYLVANPLRSGLVERIGDYPLWNAAWLPD